MHPSPKGWIKARMVTTVVRFRKPFELRIALFGAILAILALLSFAFGGSAGCGGGTPSEVIETPTTGGTEEGTTEPIQPTPDEPQSVCQHFFSLELDPDFGGEGRFVHNFDAGSNGVDLGNAIVVQNDGKVVVSGYVDWTNLHNYCPAAAEPCYWGDHNAHLGLIRLNTNGTPDTTFGTDGIVVLDDCNSFWGVQWWAQQGLAIQSDGKILVGGDCNMRARTYRLNTDGSVDATFGTGGYQEFDHDIAGGNWSAVYSLAVQSDETGNEKIIVAGNANALDSWDIKPVWLLARLNTDGSVDASFGDQPAHPGVVIEDWGSTHNDGIRDLVILPDRRIVAYGNSSHMDAALNIDFAIARYSADGILDTTFATNDSDGIDGFARIDFGETDWSYPATMTPDGKIVAGSHINCCWDTSDTGIFEVTTEGTLDSTFGTNGMLTLDMGLGHQDFANSLAALPNGNLIVAGYANDGSGISDTTKPWQHDDFAITLLTSDGQPAPHFGTDGVVRTDFYQDGDGINAIALADVVQDAEGNVQSFRVIAVGTTLNPPRTDNDFAIAAYRSVSIEICTQ